MRLTIQPRTLRLRRPLQTSYGDLVEREIFELVALGLTNVEIADRLWLSPLTVKTHVSRILGKLGARDRVQLVVAAYESGLVVPGQ